MKKILELIRQNRFYSLMMILSTAITVAYVMATILVNTLVLGDISPENKRSRTASIAYYKSRDGQIYATGGTAKWVIDELMDSIECVEMYTLRSYQSSEDEEMTSYDGSIIDLNVVVASENIFEQYDYEILEGRAFTAQDVEAESRVAVLSQLGAYRLLGRNSEVVGEHFLYRGINYEVIGLTRNTSCSAQHTIYNSFFEVLLPYSDTSIAGSSNMRGYLVPDIVIKKGYTFSELAEDLLTNVKEFNSKYSVSNGGYGIYESFELSRTSGSMKMINFALGFMCLVFVLIPSINGISLTQSYLSHRLSEIAIRKAYGASSRQLVLSLVMDNIWITAIGGVLGLVFAYYLSGFITSMLSGVGANEVYQSVAFIPRELFFDFRIYLLAIATNILFNICAIYFPARRAVRQPISRIIKGDF